VKRDAFTMSLGHGIAGQRRVVGFNIHQPDACFLANRLDNRCLVIGCENLDHSKQLSICRASRVLLQLDMQKLAGNIKLRSRYRLCSRQKRHLVLCQYMVMKLHAVSLLCDRKSNLITPEHAFVDFAASCIARKRSIVRPYTNPCRKRRSPTQFNKAPTVCDQCVLRTPRGVAP
jgi:hypothetical protein